MGPKGNIISFYIVADSKRLYVLTDFLPSVVGPHHDKKSETFCFFYLPTFIVYIYIFCYCGEINKYKTRSKVLTTVTALDND